MTIILGWWIIPAAITLMWLIYFIIEMNEPAGAFIDLRGLGSVVGLIPVLLSWLIYFICKVWFI